MLNPSYRIPRLPLEIDLETRPVLKQLALATRALAELKGRAASIPNQGILIDTLALQEAKASSEIENIVTTEDELYQLDLFPEASVVGPAKEVALYRDALKLGYAKLKESGGLISNATIIAMFQLLKGRSDGFRMTPGTSLRNDLTGQIVYVPPQAGQDIIDLMTNLERFINDHRLSNLDPLIKMAVIHHQFESIHPFPDGNGRIGRILNVLYMTQTDLLEVPALYLSRHIMHTKSAYYALLQQVRDTGEWESWVLYVLEAVERTAKATLDLIEGIRLLMQQTKTRMRDALPRIYSQDLLNNLFRHPYTRIDFVARDLKITRQTASKHLDELASTGFVLKRVSGRNNYYINTPLVSLLMTANRSYRV